MTFEKSVDGQALSFALKCDLPALKRVALRYVHSAILKFPGATTKIAEHLGISTSTYHNWLNTIEELRELHYGERPEKMIGRVPKALKVTKRRSKAS